MATLGPLSAGLGWVTRKGSGVMFGLGYVMRSCIVCGKPFPEDEGGFASAPGMRVDDMTCWAFHPDCWEEAPSFVDFLEGAA